MCGGQGSISAVNLMEFDQRMDLARTSHRECVVAMKSFWRQVAKRGRQTQAQDAPVKVRRCSMPMRQRITLG